MKTKTLKLTLTKLADVTRELQELVAGNPDKAFSIKVSDWSAKRSLSANAQQHVLVFSNSKTARGYFITHS